MLTRVAAVQLPFTFFSTPQEFADLVRVRIETAAEGGAELIVLPHLASLMLFGMFDVGAEPSDSLEQLAARQNLGTPEWLEDRAGYVSEFYLHLFQSLAERVEKWLAPGTVLEPDGQSLHLTAYLLNPAGEIVGRQTKLNLTDREKQWGVTRGETLRVFETEIGDFGFVIGKDAQQPEIGKALSANGANVLLHPAASRTDRVTQEPAGELAQMTQAYVVKADLVGGGFQGRSGIYAPGDGSWKALAEATTDTDEEILGADLEIGSRSLTSQVKEQD